MSQLKKKISKLIREATEILNASGSLSQEMNSAADNEYYNDNIAPLIRKSGAEGCVLLKNEGTLPLKSDDVVSVFGRCQINWFCVGYGSGGDVQAPYKVNLLEALRKTDVKLNEKLAGYYEKWCSVPKNVPDEGFWGHWPMCYDEMPLSAAMVSYAAIESNKAIFVIGRASGEDRENKLTKGSYYLTDVEEKNLRLVCDRFKEVVVIMDCGNVIDMSWVEKYDSITAVLYAWQCGQESGNSAADILTGRINPSGKLSDTIARYYDDYPSAANFGKLRFNNYAEDIYVGYRYFETFAKEEVLYPFGFGLSYTEFSFKSHDFIYADGKIGFSVDVTNIGSVSGKETVQVYVSAPQGKLGKAARSLVAFEKTKLLEPGETQTVDFEISEYEISSYDDEGKTGYQSCYVLEKGNYVFYVGASVRADKTAGSISVDKTKRIQRLEEVCSVADPFKRLVAFQNGKRFIPAYEMLKKGKRSLHERILDNIPHQIGYKGDMGYKLSDVKSGRISLDEFISQLGSEELEALTRGHGTMQSSYGVIGNAGAFGGITDKLTDFGVSAMITTDGPSGIRIKHHTSLIPCGTALGCTWNKELVSELFEKIAAELEYHKIDVLLSPGMNIHRNPLCGRNFEYYSEDPVLSGEIAAAAVKGIQSRGASACPKHFACNNQEVNRNRNDSRVSERALREIYLKGFEIVVKKAKPMNIMTSYNKINGVWSHYNYDLVTTVLRDEWGYEGNVITDWWMRKAVSPEFPQIRDNAYRVRAQVDVLMPGNMNRNAKGYVSDGTLLETLGSFCGITRAELERTARNVLSFVLKRMN
ncbi:MAG: glycoside hydrolase family 3 C-terminal domain-containing protein [Oscillospiraceae bacterium]|nr:glycoside hydrolase family 3 C-terminal domain-containing protein [Oscillospiraceae bacterium]